MSGAETSLGLFPSCSLPGTQFWGSARQSFPLTHSCYANIPNSMQKGMEMQAPVFLPDKQSERPRRFVILLFRSQTWATNLDLLFKNLNSCFELQKTHFSFEHTPVLKQEYTTNTLSWYFNLFLICAFYVWFIFVLTKKSKWMNSPKTTL